jgi:hypothetical protein
MYITRMKKSIVQLWTNQKLSSLIIFVCHYILNDDNDWSPYIYELSEFSSSRKAHPNNIYVSFFLRTVYRTKLKCLPRTDIIPHIILPWWQEHRSYYQYLYCLSWTR